jgi:hypothetical protein
MTAVADAVPGLLSILNLGVQKMKWFVPNANIKR